MRRARPDDRMALDAFLGRHSETSMFPRTNLAQHGLGGSGHPHATRFWIARDGEGPVRAALGLTGAGMILPQMADALAPDWRDVPRVLRRARVTGIVGPAAQVRRLRGVPGLAAPPTRHAAEEPGFALALDALRIPPAANDAMTPAGAADPMLLCDWRAAYHVEVLGAAPEHAGAQARRDIDLYLAAGTHRVLWRDDQPVAFCGFNAVLPDIVQVGGVWVPPALRGQHLARRAVALHLSEARAAGVRRACLFAASPAAARAYRAIGFAPAAPIAVVLFREGTAGPSPAPVAS